MVDDRISFKFSVDADGKPAITAYFVARPTLAITRHYEVDHEYDILDLIDGLVDLSNSVLATGYYLEKQNT